MRHQHSTGIAAIALLIAFLTGGCADADWSQAQDEDTIGSYRDFVNKHPNSEHANKAISRATQLVQDVLIDNPEALNLDAFQTLVTEGIVMTDSISPYSLNNLAVSFVTRQDGPASSFDRATEYFKMALERSGGLAIEDTMSCTFQVGSGTMYRFCTVEPGEDSELTAVIEQHIETVDRLRRR